MNDTAKAESRRGRRLRERLNAPLLGVLALAAALRLWAIGAKELWLDEILSVVNAARPYGEMIEHLLTFDAHPPLFQSLVWLWIRLGRGDGFVRIPMALAGVAGVALTWLIARRLFGKTAAWTAGTLMAFSAYHIHYSQDLRLHALAATLVLAQLYVLLRILDAQGRAPRRCWAAYGLLGILCLYTYALCIYTLAAFALAYLVVGRRRRMQWRAFLITHAVAGLVFLPWAPVVAERTQDLRATLAAAGDAQPAPGFVELAESVASWATAPTNWTPLHPAGALIGFGLVALITFGVLVRKDRRPAVLLALAFFVPMLLYALMPAPRVHAYDPKHLIFLQPLVFIGLSGVRFPRRKRPSSPKPAWVTAAVLLVLNAGLLVDYYRPSTQKARWAEAYADLRARLAPEDGLVFNPGYLGFAFTYYAESEADRAALHQRAGLTARALDIQEGPSGGFRPERVWVVSSANPAARRAVGIDARLAKHGLRPSREPSEQRSYPGEVGAVTWRLWRRRETGGRP
jgi:4-amino-4-deoxy-L-arabinose transferase-like glycosyltransferase